MTQPHPTDDRACLPDARREWECASNQAEMSAMAEIIQSHMGEQQGDVRAWVMG